MNLTYFAFIRHGHYHQPEHVPSALLPHPLTEKGREQSLNGAKEVLEFLKNNSKITLSNKLYCSTLLRAFETTEILRNELSTLRNDLEIIQSDELCERSVGPMANLTVSEIEKIIAIDPRYDNLPEGWKSSTHYKLPYATAESLDMAGKRVFNFVQSELIHRDSSELALFVGHGASIRHAARYFKYWDEEQIKLHSMYYAKPVFFELDKDSMSIRLICGQWKVRPKKDEIND